MVVVVVLVGRANVVVDVDVDVDVVVVEKRTIWKFSSCICEAEIDPILR